MRLNAIQAYLNRHNIRFQYAEDFDCGSIDFIHKGLSYHIWEFPPEEQGAESNVRSVGRMEVYSGDYEQGIIDVMETWW